MQLRIKKPRPDAILPSRKKPGDSGLDLHAMIDDDYAWILPGERLRIMTGIAIELPLPVSAFGIQGEHLVGYEAQVRPRSGLASEGIICAFGTIDSGYRGEIGVTLFNYSFDRFRVRHGDRVAQLVICPVALPEVVEVEELSETERGKDGFGSTGV